VYRRLAKRVGRASRPSTAETENTGETPVPLCARKILISGNWAAMKAAALTAKFVQDWWMPSLGLFADSLALTQSVHTDPMATLGSQYPYTQLQQLYWTNATPMETGIASTQEANAAFTGPSNLESSVFTGNTGFYQEGQSAKVPRPHRYAKRCGRGTWPSYSLFSPLCTSSG
jgi:hypothetical protein